MITMGISVLLLVFGSLLCGFLGALGGADRVGKGVRRIGIPVFLTTVAFFATWNPIVLGLLLLIPILSLGYGAPSPDDDKPSDIGAFFARILSGKLSKLLNFAIRSTIGLMESIPLVVTAVIKGRCVLELVLAFFIVATEAVFGAIVEGEGQIKLFGRYLLIEEIIRFTVLGLAYLLAILI